MRRKVHTFVHDEIVENKASDCGRVPAVKSLRKWIGLE